MLITFKNLSDICESQTTDETTFHKTLGQLMKCANRYYNSTYNAPPGKSRKKQFSLCEEQFNTIKQFAINRNYFKKSIYVDAWISELWAALNALNYQIKSNKHLIKFKQKIREIESNLSKLSEIDISNTSQQQLVRRIKGFKENWEANKFRRLADAYYNFAEFLTTKKDFKQAEICFSQSIEFYNTAAKKNNQSSKMKLTKYAEQTQKRLIQVLSSNNSLENHLSQGNLEPEKENNVRASHIKLTIKRSHSGTFRVFNSRTESNERISEIAPKVLPTANDTHLPFKKRKFNLKSFEIIKETSPNNTELQDSITSPHYFTRGFFKQISSQENDVCPPSSLNRTLK